MQLGGERGLTFSGSILALSEPSNLNLHECPLHNLGGGVVVVEDKSLSGPTLQVWSRGSIRGVEVWAWAGWWLWAGWSLAAVECGWIILGARTAERGREAGESNRDPTVSRHTRTDT